MLTSASVSFLHIKCFSQVGLGRDINSSTVFPHLFNMSNRQRALHQSSKHFCYETQKQNIIMIGLKLGGSSSLALVSPLIWSWFPLLDHLSPSGIDRRKTPPLFLDAECILDW